MALLSINTYTLSQTLTIPSNCSKAIVYLIGAGGGGCGTGTNGTKDGACGGGGGYLMKYLTGLTAGSTLTLTIGAAGSGASANNDGTAGGATTLVSGTQTISTLTAGGGNGATHGGTGPGVSGTGGASTGGDVNIAGSEPVQIFSVVTLTGTSVDKRPYAGTIDSAGYGYKAVWVAGSSAYTQDQYVYLLTGSTSANGVAAVNYGMGGCASWASTQPSTGSAGTQGLAIVEWWN